MQHLRVARTPIRFACPHTPATAQRACAAASDARPRCSACALRILRSCSRARIRLRCLALLIARALLPLMLLHSVCHSRLASLRLPSVYRRPHVAHRRAVATDRPRCSTCALRILPFVSRARIRLRCLPLLRVRVLLPLMLEHVAAPARCAYSHLFRVPAYACHCSACMCCCF